jgi:hypothetical protein
MNAAMKSSAVLSAYLVLACSTPDKHESTKLDASDANVDAIAECVPELDALRVYACAQRKEGATKPPFSIDITGTVLATGSINEFEACANTSSDVGGFWFEMDDTNGERWVLGAMLPAANPPAVGDTVSATASRAYGYPVVASITLRDVNGKLIAYVGEAGDAAELQPPDGIVLSRGQAMCTGNHGCGDWKAYHLDLDVGGTTGTLAYGTSANIGAYQFAHGGAELQAGTPPDAGDGCSGVSVARTVIGITPLQ